MVLPGVQEEVETGLVLGTVEEEEVVAAVAEVEEAGVVVWGQVVGNTRARRLETGGPAAGWETAPSALA